MFSCTFNKQLHTPNGPQELKIDLSIPKGEIFALFGPSGVGKTVTLQIISGLESVNSGHIRWQNEVWLDTGREKFVPPEKRNLAMVFQAPVLFPNMTVLKNLLFAAKARSTIQEIESVVKQAGIAGLTGHYPQDLSGGQRQRVAIARALLRKARLMLLDEPFSALDIAARYQLYDLIRQHHSQHHPTILFVSHLPGDIFALAERIAVMDQQGITAIGKPFDLLIEKGKDSALEIEGEILQIEDQIVTVAFGNDTRQIRFSQQQLKFIKPGDKRLFSVGSLQPTEDRNSG